MKVIINSKHSKLPAKTQTLYFLPDLTMPFFVNGRGKALARLQNTPGSYLSKVGLAVGIPDLSTTDLRRSAEGVIQTSDDMKKNADKLNMHSDKVGRQIYDVSKFTIRPEWINFLEHKEGANEEQREEEDMSEFEKARRQRMYDLDLEDAIIRIRNAKKFLTDEKIMKRKSAPLGPRSKLSGLERIFLQTLVLQKVFNSAENPQFPRGK